MSGKIKKWIHDHILFPKWFEGYIIRRIIKLRIFAAKDLDIEKKEIYLGWYGLNYEFSERSEQRLICSLVLKYGWKAYHKILMGQWVEVKFVNTSGPLAIDKDGNLVNQEQK